MKTHILIVDDEKSTRDLLARALGDTYDVATAADAELALAALNNDPEIALMLSDVRMPGMNGMDLVKAAKARHPDLMCMLLTAYGSIEQALAAVKEYGADDFATKPVDLSELESRIAKNLKAARLEHEVASLRKELDEKYAMENITGNSEAMKRVFRLIRQAAPTDATILIEGPSGTGKELVAHAIHNLSHRARGPFVAVQCGALPEALLESELFGHEKGAFTSAVARHVGRFEQAHNGTIFLDEISEISPATQVKLLRVLETRTFTRLGGTETLSTNIRIVAATNRDLARYVSEGKFREDLYWRLNVVDLHLPALKDRAGDVPLLASRFIREFSAANGNRVTGITPGAMKLLENWPWPGNVRELRNTVEKMVVLAAGGLLDVADVPENIRREQTAAPLVSTGGTLDETEKAKILATLRQTGGNRSKAAKLLGISRRTIYRKLEDYAARGEVLP